MGILLDVVQPHGDQRPRQHLVARRAGKGEGSYFAGFFDIDWHRPATALHGKVLLIFGRTVGRVLENGEMQIIYDDQRLQLCHGPRRYPLGRRPGPTSSNRPTTWVHRRLRRRASELDRIELQSIITQLRNLPPAHRRDPFAMEERYREQKIARRSCRFWFSRHRL